MNDVMIDIETMGTGHKAVITSIGAAYFDRTTSDIGEKYYAIVDWEQPQEGRILDPSTVKWWLKQSDDARAEMVKDDGVELMHALDGLRSFIDPCACVWGNGANFDIGILTDAYERNGFCKKTPWKFRNIRDVRTVVDLASDVMRRPKMPEGDAHNALNDAIHQAQYVSNMIQRMRCGF